MTEKSGADILVEALCDLGVEVVFGYPGGAEVVNMRPPAALIRAGVHALPCIGDGRQSGTSGSPSKAEGSASKAGVPAKRGHTAAVCILEELEVVELAAAALEAAEHIGPALLVLVAVGELDVRVLQIGAGRVELFQADDRGVLRRLRPGVVLGERASDTG